MTLLGQYEQQYAALIATITAQIGRLQLHEGLERRELYTQIDTNLVEAQELLEQISLEIRELAPQQRTSYTNKHNCAQVELKRLQNEYRVAKDIANKQMQQNATTIDLDSAAGVGDYLSIDYDQRQRLLDNSERIERTGNRLFEGYRVALETETLGAQVLNDLHHQRETLESSRSRLRETNAELGRASRTLNSMMMRALREKAILYVVGGCFIIAVIVSIYLTFAPSSSSSSSSSSSTH